MDGLKLIRKQDVQDSSIAKVTDEVTKARTSVKQTYPTLKARLDAIDTNADIIQNNINQAIAGLQWKASVPTFNDLAVAYPNPQEGWTVSTDDTNIIYRFDDATNQWHAISSNAIGNAVPNGNAGLMTGADKAKLDGLDATQYVKKTGDTMTGNLNFDNNNIGLTNAGRLYLRGTINSTILSSATSGQIYFRPNGDRDTTGEVRINNGGNVYAPLFVGNLNGNATSATRLQNARTIQLTGAVTGQAKFDGSQNIAINTTIANPYNARLNTLRRTVEVQAEAQTINIGIAGYNTNNDVLNVYLSGVRLTPVTEYTSTQADVTLVGGERFVVGDVVTFEVIQTVRI